MTSELGIDDLEVVKYEVLHVDHDEEDTYIKQLIIASKSFVETYLNQKLSEFGETYPAEIDIARMQLINQWYEDRVIMSPRSNVKEMAYAFSDLLDPHRHWNIVFLGSPINTSGDENSFENLYSKYQRDLAMFYKSEIVDTYSAITGDEERTNAPDTRFVAPIDEVDYNQRKGRDS